MKKENYPMCMKHEHEGENGYNEEGIFTILRESIKLTTKVEEVKPLARDQLESKLEGSLSPQMCADYVPTK
jgi:hypothetical protein